MCTHARSTHTVTLPDLKPLSALCNCCIEGSFAMPQSSCCAGPHVLAWRKDVPCQHALRQQVPGWQGVNNTSRSSSARSWWLLCASGCSCRLAVPACRMAKSAAQWCGVVQACAHSKAHAAMSPRPRKTCTSGMLSSHACHTQSTTGTESLWLLCCAQWLGWRATWCNMDSLTTAAGGVSKPASASAGDNDSKGSSSAVTVGKLF